MAIYVTLIIAVLFLSAIVACFIIGSLQKKLKKAEYDYGIKSEECFQLSVQLTKLRSMYEETDKERDKLADIVCGDIPQTMGDLAKIIHKQAVAHGWWDDERSFPEIVALCHSELSEALEEYRSAKPVQYVVIETVDEKPKIETNPQGFGERKPEGIAVEMADCIIRILDWCGKEGIDIDDVVERKMAYNETRPYKHGNKVC